MVDEAGHAFFWENRRRLKQRQTLPRSDCFPRLCGLHICFTGVADIPNRGELGAVSEAGARMDRPEEGGRSRKTESRKVSRDGTAGTRSIPPPRFTNTARAREAPRPRAQQWEHSFSDRERGPSQPGARITARPHRQQAPPSGHPRTRRSPHTRLAPASGEPADASRSDQTRPAALSWPDPAR